MWFLFRYNAEACQWALFLAYVCIASATVGFPSSTHVHFPTFCRARGRRARSSRNSIGGASTLSSNISVEAHVGGRANRQQFDSLWIHVTVSRHKYLSTAYGYGCTCSTYIRDMFFHMSICLTIWCRFFFLVDGHLGWMPGGSEHHDRANEQKKQASQSGGRFHSKHSLNVAKSWWLKNPGDVPSLHHEIIMSPLWSSVPGKTSMLCQARQGGTFTTVLGHRRHAIKHFKLFVFTNSLGFFTWISLPIYIINLCMCDILCLTLVSFVDSTAAAAITTSWALGVPAFWWRTPFLSAGPKFAKLKIRWMMMHDGLVLECCFVERCVTDVRPQV